MVGLADRLKQLRGRDTREDFAKKIGISIRSLVNYEQGERVPNAEAIGKICAQTSISADWLLFGTGENKTSDKSEILGDKKEQHIEITIQHENKISDVGGFAELIQTQEKELLTLYRENNQLVRENADLRAEVSRLHSQLAAAVGALEKSTAGLTTPNAMDKAG